MTRLQRVASTCALSLLWLGTAGTAFAANCRELVAGREYACTSVQDPAEPIRFSLLFDATGGEGRGGLPGAALHVQLDG